MNITRIFYTISTLKPIQFLYRLKYIVKRKRIEARGAAVYKNYQAKVVRDVSIFNFDPLFLVNLRRHYCADLDKVLENSISFLNHEIRFGKNIDWHLDELNQGTRLWKLNLNYHEFLIDVAVQFKKTKQAIYLEYVITTIEQWFIQNPLGTKGYGKDNWNSYAISLRLIAWIKIVTLLKDDLPHGFKDKLLESLHIQALFLRDNLEFDILGNHLIKNWKALQWCGVFLNRPELIAKANELWEKYVYSQFTKNGMHEELSPMYAGIVLEDLLEVYLFNKSDTLKRLICLQYQKVLALSVGNDYTFFNDSVNKNAIYPQELKGLFERVMEDPVEYPTDKFEFDGYLGFKNRHEYLAFDAGNIVMGSQPGHGHCDALSFEYYRNGRKIFTNSGTFEYNDGAKRAYSRSTQAHNTLKYGAFEQSEVWGSFRTARRSKVNYELIDHTSHSIHVKGWVSGFDFSKQVVHERILNKVGNTIEITDTVKSSGMGSDSYIYLHLTPSFAYEINGELLNVVDEDRNVIASLDINIPYEIIYTEYYPEFGVCKSKNSLKIGALRNGQQCLTKISFK